MRSVLRADGIYQHSWLSSVKRRERRAPRRRCRVRAPLADQRARRAKACDKRACDNLHVRLLGKH
eukprot:5725683-Pleurochrysis_carterae.AAC.1